MYWYVYDPFYHFICYILSQKQSWLGSAFSSIFTCDNLAEKFQQGKCGGTSNEQQRIIFSLYFAYAVDITTDLASESRNSDSQSTVKHFTNLLQLCSFLSASRGISRWRNFRKRASSSYSGADLFALRSLPCASSSSVLMAAAKPRPQNRSGCSCGLFLNALLVR